MNATGNFLFFSKAVTMAADKNDTWFEILKVGTFDQGDGPFEITQTDLQNALAAAEKYYFQYGQEIPVFVGHKIMYDPAARQEEELSGGIDQLKVEGDRLLAHAVFVDDMAQKIRARKFRGASAEFTTNLRTESGDQLGFGLTAVGMTNVPFLGLQPISLSRKAAQESVMTFTQNEQRLMALTGTQTPEAALAKWDEVTQSNRDLQQQVQTLTSSNESLKQRVTLAEKARDNHNAKALIDRAIAQNKPVAGMVEGYDAEPTQDNQFPALTALSKIGGLAGAEHVFATIAPLPKSATGVDHTEQPPQDGDSDEIDGIPQKALTVAQAREHWLAKNGVAREAYDKQRRYFSNVSEDDFLRREGYILAEQK